jgi:hypothetical protein
VEEIHSQLGIKLIRILLSEEFFKAYNPQLSPKTTKSKMMRLNQINKDQLIYLTSISMAAMTQPVYKYPQLHIPIDGQANIVIIS